MTAATEQMRFEVLPGLPAIGDRPVHFSDTGMGMQSEGFVVKFFPREGSSWVGNFQRGLTQLNEAFQHPDGFSVVVVAGGEVYVVDVENRSLSNSFGGMFERVIEIAPENLYIFASSIHFVGLGTTGITWKSERIAVDGLRELKLEGNSLTGEAWALDDAWLPFSLDIRTGKHTGGADIWWE